MTGPAHPGLAGGSLLGEAVAAVVARDRYAAEDAAERVAVDWEPLPAALDLIDPARGGAIVHEAAPGNVLLARRFESGQVEETLAGSAAVIERTFRTNRQTAAPLEAGPGCRLARGEGKLTLWLGTQVPHWCGTGWPGCWAFPRTGSA
jgi:carbon-monoxide dehydrogenase large subunit